MNHNLVGILCVHCGFYDVLNKELYKFVLDGGCPICGTPFRKKKPSLFKRIFDFVRKVINDH